MWQLRLIQTNETMLEAIKLCNLTLERQIMENNNLLNIGKPVLDGLETIEQIKKATEYVLEKKKITTSEKALFGIKVYEEVKKEYPKNKFNQNTFIQYLSRAVRDTDTKINTLGKKQGYFISEIAGDIEKLAEESSLTDSKELAKNKRNSKEGLLYEFLVGWLQAQSYKSKNISSGKSLGKWGNPDVAGISVVDSFGSPSLEIITIEAKTSLENWEQWIFEAVSHRRFANRCYFAFAHPEEAIIKIPSDMRYYAELYNIGILILSVENSVFQALTEGKLNKPLEASNTDAIEYYSAPFNYVQPVHQMRFLKALEVTDSKSLYAWG